MKSEKNDRHRYARGGHCYEVESFQPFRPVELSLHSPVEAVGNRSILFIFFVATLARSAFTR
jgi:hypothetical protein